MSGNISVHSPYWYTVNTSTAANRFTVAAAAAAWVDTDISASDVPAAAIAIIWRIENGAVTSVVGARRNGDITVDPVTNLANGACSTISGQSAARHVDFLRNAGANTTYSAYGYLM